MQNFVQAGNAITATAPTGGVTSGEGVLIDLAFGVAATTAPEGDDIEIATVGVFDLAKEAGAAFTFGAAAYWDATAKVATPDDDTGNNLRIGIAIQAADAAAPTARVRLDGAAT